jgi:DNA-binding NtrC family response regulator
VSNAVVVGADPDERSLLRGLLRLHHHQVVAEGVGPEVLSSLDAPGGIDLLVLDEDAAGGAWKELVQNATRLRPALRVVLITPNETRDLLREARASGISAVLQRPFHLEQFIQALDRPLDRSGAYRTDPGRRTPPT